MEKRSRMPLPLKATLRTLFAVSTAKLQVVNLFSARMSKASSTPQNLERGLSSAWTMGTVRPPIASRTNAIRLTITNVAAAAKELLVQAAYLNLVLILDLRYIDLRSSSASFRNRL